VPVAGWTRRTSGAPAAHSNTNTAPNSVARAAGSLQRIQVEPGGLDGSPLATRICLSDREPRYQPPAFLRLTKNLCPDGVNVTGPPDAYG
jgi:hypothetical protein